MGKAQNNCEQNKICFVSYTNLYLAPYINNYLNQTDKKCDIIVWDRHGISEECGKHNVILLGKKIGDNSSSKLKKLLPYLSFRRKVNKILKKNKYDKVVFLQSIGAILSYKLLLKRYRNKFIIDIRDYSIEGISLLKNIEAKLVKNSALNVISSKGYKNFLPEGDYTVVHNYNKLEVSQELSKSRKPTIPIKLLYVGLIRFQQQNKKIIDLFANDQRFEIQFIGKNALELTDYVKEKGVKNVTLIDRFPPEKTVGYCAQAHAILNVYGNNTPLLDYALSTKLYLSAALKMPIIVSKDTYMEKCAVGNGFGFTLDFFDNDILDKLYDYMNNRDYDKFDSDCEKFILQVEKENAEAMAKVKRLFSGE